jgi:Ni/Co efflux regulator RcnB
MKKTLMAAIAAVAMMLGAGVASAQDMPAKRLHHHHHQAHETHHKVENRYASKKDHKHCASRHEHRKHFASKHEHRKHVASKQTHKHVS